MGLESLLERLEGRAVTRVTPEHTGGVTEKALKKQACYTVTPVTPEKVEGDPLWWRVVLIEPGGQTIEVDAPSGWTLADWQAYAERYHGPGCAVTPKALLPNGCSSMLPSVISLTICLG
jgi:hypothetical protein